MANKKDFEYSNRLPVASEIPAGVVRFYTLYRERLMQLSTIPEGSIAMNVAGNSIVWDTEMLDSIAVEITRAEAILAGF